MAKNITIAEGGVGRNFGPTKKLETDLQGGGTQLWIPEDEANDYASKEPLSVTANGTYTPSTAVGLNPVTVEVPIHLGTRPTITENGDYNAQDEGLDGFTEVTVHVDNVAHLGIGSTTANGTYTASDYEYDGFSVFTANVPAIDGEGYEVTPDEENSLVVIEDTTEDLSGIYGTSVDMETGSMYTVTNEDGEAYLVQVDTNGTVTKTLFPKGMEIVTPPNKTSYTEGETLNFSGISCQLQTKSGVYTDSVYTTGTIPYSELIFPVTVAQGFGGGTSVTNTEDILLAAMDVSGLSEAVEEAATAAGQSAGDWLYSRLQAYATDTSQSITTVVNTFLNGVSQITDGLHFDPAVGAIIYDFGEWLIDNGDITLPASSEGNIVTPPSDFASVTGINFSPYLCAVNECTMTYNGAVVGQWSVVEHSDPVYMGFVSDQSNPSLVFFVTCSLSPFSYVNISGNSYNANAHIFNGLSFYSSNGYAGNNSRVYSPSVSIGDNSSMIYTGWCYGVLAGSVGSTGSSNGLDVWNDDTATNGWDFEYPLTVTRQIPVQWVAPQPHFPVKAKFQEYFEIEVTDGE